MSKKAAVFGAGIIGLILATIPLLGSDNVPFLKWWIMVLLLGIGYYPLGAALFSSFRDRGFIFSKVLLCLIVTALSQFLSAALLCATGYLSPLYALFLFAVGVLFGFAQICIATRIDFSYAKFSSEPDGEIKESGNTVSIMIVAGLAVSFLVGGAVVLARMYFSLRGLAGQYDFITFVISGGVALVSAAVGCLFLMHNLKSRYYRFSGGWL